MESGERARSEPFPPGTTIARYRLVSLIGSGAMGDVYRAHDRALDREVALKVLPPDLVGDRERVHRFAQEARAASALSHPHIVTIHEVGHARPVMNVRAIGERPARAGEVHYISMELVDGQTLRETLAATPPLRQKIELMAQVADGLANAHAAGIIHRDLKPDNILVAREGYAKIVDFGLAKLVDTSWNPIGADSPTLRALTAHGELLGTPGYMAPEQITGKMLDPRADIFSFGCILYEAIARTRAFEAESFVDTLYKIVHEEALPIAGAPAELQRIVDRCLAKNREERYASIRDAANDLRAWNAGVAPAERPPSGRSLKLLLVAALIATVPILAVLLRRDSGTDAPKDPAVRRITSDGRASHAAISPDGRYVAYITSAPDGRALWLEQIATGRTLAVVPAGEAFYAGLTFSRDGEYLYFTRYDDGPIALLYRVSILGGDPQQVVRDIDSRAAISPDGKHIAFIRDDFNRGLATLLVTNADGSGERVMLQSRIPDRLWYPAWSPDGSSLLIAQQAKLLEVSYPAGTARRIDTNPKFEAFRGLAWPDRDRILAGATNEESSGRYRLWSIDPEDGTASALTSDLADLHNPTVSDSGSLAALQVIRQANLFEVDATGRTQQLTSGIGAANGLTGVSWIGDRVVYASAADGKHDLFALDGKSRHSTRLTDDTAYQARPAATRDGTAIVYRSGSGEQSAIWRVNPDGTNRLQLTAGPRDGDFAVSPDSQALAYASLDPRTKQWGLWTMSLSGGTPRRIATRTAVLQQIAFSADGKTIFFTGYENNTLRLYRVPAAGGAATEVIDGRAHDAAVSPDGKHIAFGYKSAETMSSSLGILTGGALATFDLKGGLYRWHPRGDAISFVREENGRMDLWLQPLDGGAPRRLTQFNEGLIADYAWSADGKRAVVAHVVDSADVVLMR